ncbi:hypothetical protein CTEN210_03747 [Chaetoceros tenuissimus]|uniref:Uncharacterized protein n=1 Tax=Chaetoceros tenuissimus TaxID=426638 RepID=A0AAD3CJN2_9STRA|nr:hypothetical protein CTEN210_03747 [Chaetoceros tenuissimus]
MASKIDRIIHTLNVLKEDAEAVTYPVGVLERLGDVLEEAMIEATGDFLHDEIDDDIHTVDQVEAMLDLVPESTAHTRLYEVDGCAGESWECYPVQSALYDFKHWRPNTWAMKFIPIIAQKGLRYGQFGLEELRGGILANDDSDYNLLQMLCAPLDERFESQDYDAQCTDVLRQLKDMGLFFKKDVRRYKLAGRIHAGNKMRVWNMLEWYPGLLKERGNYEGDALINYMTRLRSDGLSILQFADKLQPSSDLCLLFFKHEEDTEEDSRNLFEYLVDTVGRDDAIKAILETMSSRKDYKYFKLDADTNSYPFLVAAENSNVDITFHLLRENISEVLSLVMV